MNSWSDSFLSSLNTWTQVAAVVLAGLGFISGAVAYIVKKEVSRRDKITIANLDTSAKEAGKAAGEANRAAAIANEKAEAERLERIRLEAEVAPRTMTLDQQRAIASALRRFAGQTVDVGSYGLDGEGARIAGQITSALRSAGINVTTNDSFGIVAGGFYRGVQLRGPKSDLLLALEGALSNTAKLQTWVNGPMLNNTAMRGGAELRGSAAIQGGGSVIPTLVPESGPTSIFVGIKPIPVETK